MAHRDQARPPVVFPVHQRVLQHLGANIRDALARRQITLATLQQRTGLPMSTIEGVLAGEPTVAIGYYVMLLSQVRLVDDLADVGRDEVFAAKIDAIAALRAESDQG